MLITIIIIMGILNLFMTFVVGCMVKNLTLNEGFTKLIRRIEDLENKVYQK
jgi:hypothetical protein